jgi:hypothetical protein
MGPVVLPDCKLCCDIAQIKQHADKPLLLFHGAHLTVNSAHCHQARLKMGGSVQGRGYQLLQRMGLVVRLMDVNGSIVRVTAGSKKDGPGCFR